MDLLIDIGNTNCKYAVSHGGRITSVFSDGGADIVAIASGLLREERAHSIVISSVRNNPSEYYNCLCPLCDHLTVLNHMMRLPLTISYDTPDTLGADRLASAIGAHHLFPDDNLLIFDFGTALTVDTVLRDGTFAGGNISAGLHTRLQALNHFTGKLPLVDSLDWPDNLLPGCSTRDAIIKGTVFGMKYEVEGYLAGHQGYKVLFTGGDALFFAKRIKNPIFVVYNLVLNGLAYLAQCNEEEQH